MATKNQIQRWMNSSPAIATPRTLAEQRTDPAVPRYRDMPETVRREWLESQMVMLYTFLHQPADDKPLGVDAALLDEYIMDDAAISGFVQAEFREAFTKGIRGDYGEYFGLTAQSLYGFLRGFLGSGKRQEADRMVRAAFEERCKREREAEQGRIRAEVEEAKRNGTFTPSGPGWWRPKTVDGVLSSKEHREKVRRQAEKILREAGL